MTGNLTIFFVINAGGKSKTVNLLKEYHINEKVAAETKANFIKLNDKFLDTDRIVCLWQPLARAI